MEALKAEVDRKRKEITDAKGSAKKYQRRGDGAVTLVASVHPIPLTITAFPPATTTLQSKKESEENLDSIILSSDEIQKRLRALNEPIRLFGESDTHRFKRLSTLSTKEERSAHQNDFKQAWLHTDNDLQKNIFDQSTEHHAVQQVDPTQFKQITIQLFNSDSERNKNLITGYLKYLLDEWEICLRERAEHIKSSASGKMLTAAHVDSI